VFKCPSNQKSEIDIEGYFDASFGVHADMKSHSGNVIVIQV
jgi:hypothetical protein